MEMTDADTEMNYVHLAFQLYKKDRGLKTSGYGLCQLLGHRAENTLPETVL